MAVDDTKLHRTSEGTWGTCTFHEYAARNPNRAETVRTHNWVVMDDLLPGQPWTFLPHSSRLYFRRNQLPEGETFRNGPAKHSWRLAGGGRVFRSGQLGGAQRSGRNRSMSLIGVAGMRLRTSRR